MRDQTLYPVKIHNNLYAVSIIHCDLQHTSHVTIVNESATPVLEVQEAASGYQILTIHHSKGDTTTIPISFSNSHHDIETLIAMFGNQP